MISHSKMYLSRTIWIFAFIALQNLIKDTACQDWLKVYPAFFDSYNGFATEGPQTAWDANQYSAGNQQVVGEQSQVNMHSNVMQAQTPIIMNHNQQPAVLQTPNAERTLNTNVQSALLPVRSQTGVIGTSSQDNNPSQTQRADANSTMMQADNQNLLTSNTGHLESPSQSSNPGVPQNQVLTSNQLGPNMVPMPVENQDLLNQQSLNLQQSQSVVAPIESYPMQMAIDNSNVPVQNGPQQSLGSGMVPQNQYGQLAASPVNHYIMPANRQTNPMPMAPYYAYPMNPNAKADLIKYMRQTAMQFYDQYSSYPQMNWNPPAVQQPGTSLSIEQPVNTSGVSSASESPAGVDPPASPILEKEAQNVDISTVGYETHQPTLLSTTVSGPSTLEYFVTSTAAPLVNSVKIDTSNTSLNPKTSKGTSLSNLDKLTPHKNMTNEELQKIIRILLVPHKMTQLAKAKAPVRQRRINQRNTQRAAVSFKRIVSAPPTPTRGDSRRPVSEMHIKMINYAPSPSHGLPAGRQKPLSEIEVKLVNYDQKIVDKFKSHISSPFATRSKWVSTPGQKIPISKISQLNTTRTPSRSNTTLASKTVAPNLNATSSSHVGTQSPRDPPNDMDRHRTQEDVKNHQKAVVRHTQMLHHVMGSLKNELNRFQGSVRRSRTLVPAAAPLPPFVPKQAVEATISKNLGTSSSTTQPLSNSSLVYSYPQKPNKTRGVQQMTNNESTLHNAGIVVPVQQKSRSLSNLFANLKAKRIAHSAPTTVSPLITTSSFQIESMTTSGPSKSRPPKKIYTETALGLSQGNGLKSTNTQITNNQNEAPYTLPEANPPKVKLSIYSVLDKARKKAMGLMSPNKPVAEQTTPSHTTTASATSSKNPLPQITHEATTVPGPRDQTTEKKTTMSKQLLDERLGEQLDKLNTLHNQKKLMKQQQILKDQHERLQKQRDLLQQQLKSLQALRGGPPLAVPDTPAGLAALMESLQKTTFV